MIRAWRHEHGRRHASGHTIRILDAIERRLEHLDQPRPIVTAIRIGAGPRDLHDFEVELELAPGTVLAPRCQSVDDDDRDPETMQGEAGAVAQQAAETAAEFLARGTSRLADLLHDMRLRTRKAIAGWRTSGIDASLVDVRFVRTEHSRDEDALAVEIRLLAIDGHLRPAVEHREVCRPELLDRELGDWRASLTSRFGAQAALAEQGADGIVDQLALNAIAGRWDTGSALRGIARGDVYGHSQDLTVFVEEGHVRCHGRTSDGALMWNRDTVTIFGQSIPASVAIAIRGRPITALIEHPVLSDDMAIVEVEPSLEHGDHAIRVEIDQPRLLFCSASGRIWVS